MKTQRKQFVVTAVMAALVLTFLIAPIAMAFVPGVVGQAKHSVATKDVCPTDGVTVNLELTGQSDRIQGGKDIVLVIDRSLSMGPREDYNGGYFGGKTKLQLAKEAAVQFVSLMDFQNDQIGIVAFAGSAITVQNMTNDKNSAINAINSIALDDQGTGTNIYAGLDNAKNLFQGGTEGAIVLLTDGKIEGYHPGNQQTIDLASTIKLSGITIFTVGLGKAPYLDEDLLKTIAGSKETEQNNGSGADYYYGQAQVPQQLADIYNRIHNSIYYAPAATNITIVEHVADNVTLIPDSFAGFGTANYSADGKTITITLSQLANGANKFSYQVNAPEGNYAVVKDGNVTYTDPADGQQKSMAFTGDTTVNVNAANCGAPPNEIPEPTTILLLGSGLAGLAGYVRRKRNHA